MFLLKPIAGLTCRAAIAPMGKLLGALDFLINLGGPFLVYHLAEEHMSTTVALKIILDFTLPISEFIVISPVLGYGIYFGLMGCSFWYGNQRRKAGERLAALAANR
jgi:hypothetical protein